MVKEGSASIEEGVGVCAIAKQARGEGVQAWKRSELASLRYQPIDRLTCPPDGTLIFMWPARGWC
jgi:hypothetical protein